MSNNQLPDSQKNPEGSQGVGKGSEADWRGTFEVWQNPAFGALHEKYCNQKRVFFDDIQAFISRRPLIGNLSLKIYCPPFSKQSIGRFISAAAELQVARMWIYSVNKIMEIEEHLKETCHTYILDLSCEADMLWKNLGSKTRNMVRKGEKKGVLIKQAGNEYEFNAWWKTYVNTAKTKEFDTQNYDLVLAIFRDSSLSKLFVSMVDGQVAGGCFFLVNNYPMYWLGAFDRKYLDWSPSNLCIWKSVLWFQENGFKLLDLGGAVTDREHGPTQFKKSLGGRLVDAYVYVVPVSGIKNKLLNTIMLFYGKS